MEIILNGNLDLHKGMKSIENSNYMSKYIKFSKLNYFKKGLKRIKTRLKRELKKEIDCSNKNNSNVLVRFITCKGEMH